MQYRRLGRAGIKLSALSLGGWTTFGASLADQVLTRRIIATAYDHGVNFFDMADAYARGECEKVMGQALKQFPRHTLVLASKVFRPMSDDINDRGLSRKHIMESVDRSLRRIGTDYLDIYFCHRDDPETPLDETVRAMDDLVRAGKVLYWGTSEWPAERIGEAIAIAGDSRYAPQVEQSLYNLLARDRVDREIVPLAERHGLGLVTWSPLASGLLTGKYDDGIPEGSRMSQMENVRDQWYRDDMVERVRKLRPIADELGVSRGELALAWLLQRPAITSVITGASSVVQLEANLKAAEVTIEPEVAAKIDQVFPPGAG